MDSNIFNWILISIAILILIIIGYKILNYRDYYSSIEKINYELFKKFTILDILSYISREYPDKPALKIKNKNWKTVSYSSYHDNVVKFAESINSWLGDEIRVAIMGVNGPGWVYSHLGCMLNNGISIGIYSNIDSKMCEYIINDSKAEMLVIDGDEQLEKISNINLENVKLIVYYSPIKKTEIVEKLSEKIKIPILSMGNFMTKQNKIEKKPELNHVCMLSYTAGTTENPKGTIITHKNIIASIMNVINLINDNSKFKNFTEEQYISHLPLNNITTLIMDIYFPICTIGTVWFANKNNLNKTIIDVKPTIFIGTPQTWKNICNEMKKNSSMLLDQMTKIIYPKLILEKTGFDKCKLAINFDDFISEYNINYLNNIGLKIYNIY